MTIYTSQILATNWAIGNILEDVRSPSVNNLQYEITDYDPETKLVSLEPIDKINNLKSEFIFSRIIAD